MELLMLLLLLLLFPACVACCGCVIPFSLPYSSHWYRRRYPLEVASMITSAAQAAATI
jgi:hypothetical protein